MASRDKNNYQTTLQNIGDKLTELRIKKGYESRIEFAGDYDLPHIQYWRMEKGVANLTFKSLDRVLNIHGLTIEQLFDQLKGKPKVKGKPVKKKVKA